MTDYLRDRLVAAVGDHYLIEAELGRGGMAAVFRALDVRLNRRVAIKVLPPELAFNPSVRSRFLREAQMAAGLTHPNIVPIYMVDEADGLVFFAMALVNGESLAARLAREGSLPIEHVRGIISDVADALDYAHRQGVVHRDIKPDNILLDRATGRPLVTDFGIARAAAEESRLTVTGMAVGTPAYMSPEQALGERDVDGRSDMYSLGIVAYQMLAGETPFKATNTPAMLMKHVSEPPPPLRGRRADVPASLASAIEHSLAKRPDDRWRSAAEMRDAILGRPMARPYPEPPPPHIPTPPPPPSSSRPPQSARLPRGYPEPVLLAPPRPLFNAPPVGMSRRERKDWYREQRDAQRAYARSYSNNAPPEDKVASKISKFRRNLLGYPAVALMLLGINAAVGGEPWFIFPSLALGVALVFQAGWLWGEGVTLRQVLSGPVRRPAAKPTGSHSTHPTRDAAEDVVTREVLDGPHGVAIRRAVASRQVITDLLARMTPKEREILPPDLQTTVQALVERVASVGMTLHRLDTDASGSALGTLDERIDGLKREPQSSERERRISLLERQRSTLRDLLERRSALLSQLESASLALENLKLDLVRFRSAGVSSALDDVTSATREARAVSRDIGHLLDAQDEVKRL
ncbi:MAG: protein kinase [Gemmatimonadaceae bacterium]